MTNTVLIKRSSVANSVPSSGNLQPGELAINYNDGNLFYKNASNVVTTIASNKFTSVSGNVTGGNIVTGGIVTAAGNITSSGNVEATYFIGNGSLLTGITAGTSYSNSNVAAYLASGTDSSNIVTTANLSGGNVLSSGIVSSVGIVSSGTVNFVSSGNISLGNLGNVHISGGTNGYVLSTNGSGNLTWVAQSGGTGGSTITVDDFTGNGVQTEFTLSVTPPNIDATTVNYNGVIQLRTGYSISGANVVFTTPPANGSSIEVTTINAVVIGPAGSNTEVQFNDNGTTGASAAFTFNNSSNILSVAGNISGTYFIGNGALLTGITGGGGSPTKIINGTSEINIGSTGGNANVTIGGSSNVVVFASTGVFVTGVASASGNVTGGNVLTGGLISATSNIISAANVRGGNILTDGIVSAAGNLIAANVSTNIVSATGNLTAANINTAGLITATGNLSAGNVSTGNVNLSNINVAGFVTSNLLPLANVTYNLGNSTLRWNELWLASSTIYIGNSSISANSESMTLTNPAGGSLTIAGSSSDLVAVNVTATGNVVTGNVYTTGILSSTGNVIGGNLVSNGLVSASGTGYFGSGLTVVGNITASGNINYQNVTDLVVGDPLIYVAANNTSNLVDIGMVGSANVAGTYQHLGFVRDHSSGTWRLFANVVAEPTTVIDWANSSYAAFAAGAITSNATISATGLVIGSHLSTSGTVSATGTITGGNVQTGGLISATGNITAGNVIGGANVYATTHTGTTASMSGNIAGGNVLTGGLISAASTITSAANITGSNLLTGGLISSTGNIIAGNVLGGANVNATTHTGTTVSVSSNITGGNVLTGGLISATGNIISAGNISATYFVGNGSLLTGISGGSGSPGGANTQIQFNDGGTFGGDAGLSFNKTNTTLTANNFVATSTANLGNIGNVYIAGGVNGYVLSTNGSGNLTWVAQSGGGGGGAGNARVAGYSMIFGGF